MLRRKSFSVRFISPAFAYFVGIVVLCLMVSGAAVADTADADLKSLKDALAASASRNKNFTVQLQNLDDDIRKLKGSLVVAAKVITSLDKNLVDVEHRLSEIRQVEDDTLEDLAKRNKELASTLSALVNLSRQPAGTIVGNPAGLVNSLRASSLLQTIVPELKKNADQLSRQLATLKELRAQYAAEQQQFASLRDQREGEQKELDRLLTAKRTAQNKLSVVRDTEQGRLTKLTANVRNMSALLEKLESDRKKQEAAKRKRLQQEIALAVKEQKRQQRLAKDDAAKNDIPSAPAAAETVRAAPTQVASVNVARRFFDAKGTLPLPVGGRIISNYNESQKAGQQKGIVIESRSAAAVISPYDGKIAFAGPFRHYGLLLIIDHGDGFHTLLSGMGTIDGSVGQLLLAGEPVGQMENSGNTKPKLYMELRSQGAPINPIPWLLAENRKVSG
ncbi:MAG: hypothetical protein COB93_08275 [Sneathiella sp.]|nr:MAG: hypothetical protein COB93_08275 [Sneathiella sp.]